MAEAINFPEANAHYGPPPGEEDRVGWLHCHKNGYQVVSAWQFTTQQLRDLIESGEPVYLSVWYGDGNPVTQPVFPVYVGDRSEINGISADFGSVFGKVNNGETSTEGESAGSGSVLPAAVPESPEQLHDDGESEQGDGTSPAGDSAEGSPG